MGGGSTVSRRVSRRILRASGAETKSWKRNLIQASMSCSIRDFFSGSVWRIQKSLSRDSNSLNVTNDLEGKYDGEAKSVRDKGIGGR